MEEKFAQLQAKIEADQSLAEKLFNLETAEEVQGFLKTEGLEFSLEEINSLRDALVKLAQKGENGELSDEALGDVAGGVAVTTACAVISATAAAANFTHNATRGRW
ncbi:MAG TPA: Nif11-like leader peptide family natural product precursor [Syntrophomonas sp.]|jgi:predicted ribosomally synthesized peptide with nif11-like leader|nr:Nif11-like leader peptide family natural product precursor [Syntrophomonas sp.]